MESKIMNKYESSRGWRNCNPLNIRLGDKWQGLRYTQTDRVFCQFLTMSWGYRAAVKCLQSYFRYFKQTGKEWNIQNIINRWAPPSENCTTAYVDRVCDLMGRDYGSFRLADITTTPGRLQLAMLIAAMTCVECGCPPQAVPVGSLNTGFVLAGLGDPQLTSDWWR
jgi:hypothetical protein